MKSSEGEIVELVGKSPNKANNVFRPTYSWPLVEVFVSLEDPAILNSVV